MGSQQGDDLQLNGDLACQNAEVRGALTVNGAPVSSSVGPGTVNRVAKFNTATTIGDSSITDNGTKVTLGNPIDVLKVSTNASTVFMSNPDGTGTGENLWIGSPAPAIVGAEHCTAVGVGALQANTTGGHIVAIGKDAFRNMNGLVASQDSVACGAHAGEFATTAGDLVLVGYRAGLLISTGNSNTMVGSETGIACTTGGSNTCIGAGCGQSITTGNGNICLGGSSGNGITDGRNNIAIGDGTMSAAAGVNAPLNSIAIGFRAINAGAYVGSNDIAIGQEALNAATTAQNNVAIGQQALLTETSGQNNIAIGGQALASQVGVNTNIGIGALAAANLNGGLGVVAIGYQAGLNATTGNVNTFVGWNTGGGVTTGGGNTFIGPSVNVGNVTNNVIVADSVGPRIWLKNDGIIWYSGVGSPEGVLAAPVGSLYSRSDGGAGTSLYVKEAGVGNVGWVPK